MEIRIQNYETIEKFKYWENLNRIIKIIMSKMFKEINFKWLYGKLIRINELKKAKMRQKQMEILIELQKQNSVEGKLNQT
jgi:hypothetical protein